MKKKTDRVQTPIKVVDGGTFVSVVDKQHKDCVVIPKEHVYTIAHALLKTLN